MAIAATVTIPFNPALLPVSLLGSTAPDWSEWILKFFGIRVKHRGATHYLTVPLTIIIFSFLFDFKDMIFWFGVGYLTHWIADSLTISGVPLSPWDNNKIHLFGGKLKTGEMTEYLISFGMLLFALLVFNPAQKYFKSSDNPLEFNVYYIDYTELYEKKIIDEATYKEKRFKLF